LIGEIKERRFWKIVGKSSLRSGEVETAKEIEMTDQRLAPGSPFYAMEKKARSAGKIIVSLRRLRASYLAQSDMIDGTHAMTVMIPERLGWHHMFRRIDSGQISDLQYP